MSIRPLPLPGLRTKIRAVKLNNPPRVRRRRRGAGRINTRTCTRVFRKQCLLHSRQNVSGPFHAFRCFLSGVVAPAKADPLAFSPRAASPSLASPPRYLTGNFSAQLTPYRQLLVTSYLVIPIPIFIYPKAHLPSLRVSTKTLHLSVNQQSCCASFLAKDTLS